ncbi:MAG TPA: ABC transporter permease [Bacteroidales bacterium]|nr:ABC transporter permease [Bacteroidales bacterium]
MNFKNLFKIALNALLRNKFRAFLTMLGIIIGIASVIAVLGIGEGSKLSIQQQIAGMGLNLVTVVPGSQQRGGVQFGASTMQSLKERDLDAILSDCPAVIAATPEVRGNGQAVYGALNWPTSLYGENESYLKIRERSVASGRMFTDREISSAAKVCLLGKTVVQNLFGPNADPVGQVIRFKKIPFQIIGVLAPKGLNTFGQDQDDLILAPYTTVQKRVLAITWVQSIYTSAVDSKSIDVAAKQIEETVRRQHKLKASDQNDFTIRNQTELLSTFSSVSNILTVLLAAIAGISLLIGGIGIMNIMLVSVTERTREIGLRMAIGGKGYDIMLQFLSESMLISLTGGVIGILLGVVASRIVASTMGWPVVVQPSSEVLSFVVCTVIGIFFGWYPARKAANLDPIDALRYE